MEALLKKMVDLW